MKLQPYIFKPLLKTVIWGGERIVSFKAIDSDLHLVGESWEVSAVKGNESVVDGGHDDGLTLSQLIERYGPDLVGKRVYSKHGTAFPLLIKLIDARRNLSVQVHPDDEMARRVHGCNGKTEMWYVIDHEPGAQIMAGFAHDITPDDYDQLVADGSIMDVVAHHLSHRGDVYFLPAGRIHAIGAGNFIAEIQQTSDITYRVFDYNRADANGQKRELHTALAREALNFKASSDEDDRSQKSTSATSLVDCDYFTVDKHIINGPLSIDMPDSFMVVMCIEGRAELMNRDEHLLTLEQGHTALVPACMQHITLNGNATLLTAHC